LRILQVNQINQVAYILGDDLMRRGHDVEVYEPSFIGGLAPLPIKMALMPWRVLDMRRVVGKFNRNHFDIVHIHWASYGVLGLASRIPFIVQCHGTDVRYRLNHPLFRPMLTTIFHRAAAVLCITPDLLPVVQSVRPDAIFFPGPVKTDQFIPMKYSQSCPRSSWTILLFTRLDPIKGPEVAIGGIELFVRRHPDVRVELLDWGSLKERYKRSHGDRFEFISCVEQEEVQRIIWRADVVLGQFKLGILSFAELQAMSCAKPVICSFRHDDAYSAPPPLCRASTPNEVDEQLEKLFQHQEIGATLGQSAREWVIKNYDHRILGSRLEALYESILGGQQPDLTLE
jgi:glycosyltransferase involved in cell wall biosynthesis